MNIPEHPTWSIIDSSKLSTFQRCKRKYFFEYLLGWRSDTPAQDPFFGECWHIAREYQLINGYDKCQEAYEKAEVHYRTKFPEETDEIYRPKVPYAILLACIKFHNERPRDLEDNELLLTETSGTVPINNEGDVLYYRMDSVLRNLQTGKIFSWDHKSKGGVFNRQWEEAFQLSLQNGTYTHCLYCMHPIEEVAGMEFCGTAFQYLKRDGEYRIHTKRVPAFKPPDQMNAWLWTVNDFYEDLMREMDRLTHCKESDPVLMAFPMFDTTCSEFFGCPYHDYCISWQNPLQRCQEPPLGFHIERWDPSKMETTNKVDLKWS